MSISAFRASIADCVDDPFFNPESIRYYPDGLLVVEQGRIKTIGDYNALIGEYAGAKVTDYSGYLITPGFIDAHIHYPQTEMVAAYGEQLLDWLDKYTFPTERKFQDVDHCRAIASFFLDELIRNGTTTALVLPAVFPQSVEAFFEEAQQRRLRMICGKVMMDRLAPDYLLDTAESSYRDSKTLIEKWHGRDRLLYAVTPRFAASSSPEQLHLAGKLLQEFPGLYLHTHLSENLQEIELVAATFPEYRDYLDVYEQAGLLSSKSVFAHCIHLSDSEWERLSKHNCTAAFCPSSNLFLGSGLFNLSRAKSMTVKVALGTDIGAGTSFSLLHTADAAYKVTQLRGQSLSSFQALFLATLGGARALELDGVIGNFDHGKEADFVVWNLQATPLMALRNSQLPLTTAELSDCLFALIILGDDRAVKATHIMGEVANIFH